MGADSRHNRRLLVGLTGSIGAGKSTVARIFEQQGIPVLYADEIARELMRDDNALRAQITELIGSGAYRSDGTLDRSAIASVVFDDPTMLDRLNDLVHPRTIAEQGRRAAQLFDSGAQIVVCEAALIFETGGEGRFDYVVVVDAEQQTRLQRAAVRAGVDIEEIRKREERQLPASHKVERADFVIRNDAGIDDLERSARFIMTLLKGLPMREELDVDDDESESESSKQTSN